MSRVGMGTRSPVLPGIPFRAAAGVVFCLAVLFLASGCASVSLDRARSRFSARDAGAALAAMPEEPSDRRTDSLLFLLERATILQANGKYAESASEFLRASAAQERLRIGSISRSSASMIINDMTKAFTGAPFEQVLLHAFAAKNYLAMGLPDDAAVEARNILDRLSGDLDGYPDDPYSRYLAAVCLELTGDSDSASIEYRKSSELAAAANMDPGTGRLGNALRSGKPPHSLHETAIETPRDWRRDLVCFVGIGVVGPAHAAGPPLDRWGPHPYADVYINGTLAGRSVTLSDTRQMHAATAARTAAAKAAKTLVRTGLKFTAANAVAQRNDGLGALLWLLLFGMEAEDTRRWETLPRWLQVARVKCPEKVSEVCVVFRRSDGTTVERQVLSPPAADSSRLTATFARSL